MCHFVNFTESRFLSVPVLPRLLQSAQRREEDVHSAFAAADTDGSGAIDPSELGHLLASTGAARRPPPTTAHRPVSEAAVGRSAEELRRWVADEFARADADASGRISFEEFVAYHNRLVDHGLAGHQMADQPAQPAAAASVAGQGSATQNWRECDMAAAANEETAAQTATARQRRAMGASG